MKNPHRIHAKTTHLTKLHQGEPFGKLLRGKLKELGLTQKQAAKEWDVSVATIEKWLQGTRKPRGPAKKQLETILQTPISETAAAEIAGLVPVHFDAATVATIHEHNRQFRLPENSPIDAEQAVFLTEETTRAIGRQNQRDKLHRPAARAFKYIHELLHERPFGEAVAFLSDLRELLDHDRFECEIDAIFRIEDAVKQLGEVPRNCNQFAA